MTRCTSPVVLQVDSPHANQAYEAFERWAASSDGGVRVLFSPDVMMATDGTGVRGCLIDEVYWLTLWADRGGDVLRSALRDAINDVDGSVEEKDSAREQYLVRISALIWDKGEPIDSVRGLL